jgi:hypothetical protein
MTGGYLLNVLLKYSQKSVSELANNKIEKKNPMKLFAYQKRSKAPIINYRNVFNSLIIKQLERISKISNFTISLNVISIFSTYYKLQIFEY